MNKKEFKMYKREMQKADILKYFCELRDNLLKGIKGKKFKTQYIIIPFSIPYWGVIESEYDVKNKYFIRLKYLDIFDKTYSSILFDYQEEYI